MSTEMNLRLDPRVVIYCSTNSSKRSSHCTVEAQLHYSHEEYLKYKTLSRESTDEEFLSEIGNQHSHFVLP